MLSDIINNSRAFLLPDASTSLPAKPPSASAPSKNPASKRAAQMCRVHTAAERLFTHDLDQTLEVGNREFPLLREFAKTAADAEINTLTASDREAIEGTHALIKNVDHSIKTVLKKLGATEEMIQYALVNKLDIAKLIGKAINLSMAAHKYTVLSKQLATLAPGSPQAQSIEARMNTIAVRALSSVLLFPSLVKLIAPTAGPQYTIISFFASYTTESAGDLLLRDPYPGMSARYKRVARFSNILGMLAYGALTYSLLLQEKQGPEPTLSKCIPVLVTASSMAFGAQIAYDVFLIVEPPIKAVNHTAVRAARITAPIIKRVGFVVAVNLLELGVAITGRFAEVFSFMEGR